MRVLKGEIMGLKFFRDAIAGCRNFSTKTYSICKTMKKSCESTINWTKEQNDVLNHVRGGLSVFITGSAGTGKSVLLKTIINVLKKGSWLIWGICHSFHWSCCLCS